MHICGSKFGVRFSAKWCGWLCGFGCVFCWQVLYNGACCRRKKQKKKKHRTRVSDVHNIAHLSLRASPLGRASSFPLSAKLIQTAVRCSPPQFPPPRKVAVANFSRHLYSMICRSSRCLPISKNRYLPRFPCLRPATCNRGTTMRASLSPDSDDL